jgi:hypothetical protein
MSDRAAAYHPWSTYMAAVLEARHLGDRRAGTDHVLLALLRDSDVQRILNVTLTQARDTLASMDEQSLRAIGLESLPMSEDFVDQSIPPRPSARLVMTQHFKLTPAAKTALEDAHRSVRRGQHFTAAAVLRALLENQEPDPAAVLLAALGVDRVAVRAALEAEVSPR